MIILGVKRLTRLLLSPTTAKKRKVGRYGILTKKLYYLDSRGFALIFHTETVHDIKNFPLSRVK